MPSSSSQGTFWVVGTPIGNLGDFTERAKEILASVDGVYCEDTRRTRALFEALELSTQQLERLDAQVESSKIKSVLAKLEEGQNWALVSDAGTPGVSDPGARLIAALHEAGADVRPVPGVSAVTTLVSVAGLQELPFSFMGFFPRKWGDFEKQAQVFLSQELIRTGVWFESPERILASFQALSADFSDAYAFVGKEMTKLHETFFSGTVREVAQKIELELSQEGNRGEWCFLLYFSPEKFSVKNSSDWVKALQCLLDAGVSASGAALQVSQVFGIPKNEVKKYTISLVQKKN